MIVDAVGDRFGERGRRRVLRRPLRAPTPRTPPNSPPRGCARRAGAQAFVILPERISKEPLGPGGAGAAIHEWAYAGALGAVCPDPGGGARHHPGQRGRGGAPRRSGNSTLATGERQGKRTRARHWACPRTGRCARCRPSATTARCSSAIVGRGSPLKIERGLNRLWTRGRADVRPADRLTRAESGMTDFQIYLTLGDLRRRHPGDRVRRHRHGGRRAARRRAS